jgi:sporulation protein YqfC
MERRRKKEGFLERTAQVFDIPGEAAGLPRVELTGRHEVRMTNHRGILAYGQSEIIVSGGKLIAKIKGEGLELRAMTGEELLITGTVLSVELE